MPIKKIADDWVSGPSNSSEDYLDRWYGYYGGDDIDYLNGLMGIISGTIQRMERDEFPPELVQAFKNIEMEINTIDGMTGFKE